MAAYTPWIAARRVKRRWWFGYRVEYWLELEYVRVGPFDTCAEIEPYLAMARRYA